MRVGNCHCWRVKQAVRIKPVNSRAEACRQSKLVYTCHVAKSGGKLSNRNGFSWGSRCWQPVEDVDIFWLDYFCSQMGKYSSSQNAFELVHLQIWSIKSSALSPSCFSQFWRTYGWFLHPSFLMSGKVWKRLHIHTSSSTSDASLQRCSLKNESNFILNGLEIVLHDLANISCLSRGGLWRFYRSNQALKIIYWL